MFRPFKPFRPFRPFTRVTPIHIWLIAAGLLGIAARPSGALTLTLIPDTQSGAPNTTVTFSGILTNGDPTATVYLNNDSISLVGAGLTVDDTDFALNAPLSLGPNSSTPTLDLFTVTIDGTAVDGSYPGTIEVLGGADPSAQDIVATSDFTVQVASVIPPPSGTPEPGTLTLLVALGGAGGLLSRRRRRA